FPVEIVEIAALEKFDILPDVEAVAYSTPHTPDSHALHVRENETTLVYTSDSVFDEMLATFARGVDLFLIESSFVRDKPTGKHLELAEAIHLIRRVETKRAMITHFYVEWDDVDFDKEVGRLSPGCKVLQAVDGLKVSVK